MACATPVVATGQAVAALEAVAGQDLLVAEDEEGFAQAILQLLDNGDMCRRLGAAGRQYVEQHHDWVCIGKCLEQVYLSALTGDQS
jgi:glycosyltransferase involved in cell wall biosynthesis